MSQNIIKHIIIFPVTMALLAVVISLAGCTDDIIYKTAEIPDAEVEIRGEVIYKPLVPTKVQTRAEAPDGSEYRGIKSLCIFFFDSDGKRIEEYSGDVDFTPVPSEGFTHEHVTFTKRIRAGQYYIFAVANIPDNQKSDLMEKATSIEELRNYPLRWDDNIDDDLEMFGVFRSGDTEEIPDNEDFELDEFLTIDRSLRIHSWVRRAASKVTVDFDGEGLKDGVTVYIKKATLRDVASGALLGHAPSKVDADNFSCISTSYSISYGEGDDHSGWPSVTNKSVPVPADVWGEGSVNSFHDDAAKALPCYENMQGEPGASKLQDSDGDGIIDSAPKKDDVLFGTFLEVEGYYVANRPEYKSHGEIVYRFMLGKDAVKNFDLVRNHHYKITMQFKGYGNDVDWHIAYSEKYLDATYPRDVNYQGKFFMPDIDFQNIYNGGHEFDDKNIIKVTSFKTDGTNNTWIEPEISYTYYSYNDRTGQWIEESSPSPWLTLTEGEVEDDKQKQYTYTASMAVPTDKLINDLFPSSSEGSESMPFNLSNETGAMTVINTANCYMVGAPGWYCFPLVYGNAITDNRDNTSSYSEQHIVNHLGNHIAAPYIKDNGVNLSASNVSVKLIWQDAENLVTPSNISYDPDLFGGKGGIKFRIGTMQEGNAVIALIDNSASDDTDVNIDRGVYGKHGSTKAIWSWHIWATRFGFEGFEKNIRITNQSEESFDVMPVHLGWCSGGKNIRYYRRRKCDIKFKVGDNEIIRTIEQYPHFLLPRGNHPYYQWGRKDPFVGTDRKESNKAIWTHDGTKLEDSWYKYNPPRLYNEPQKTVTNEDGTTSIVEDWRDDKRHKTIECLNVLIKNPDKWHNSPRQPKGGVNNDPQIVGFESVNKTYTDLWSIGGNKTVYDPCPAGYQVGDKSVFSGFVIIDTAWDTHRVTPKYWYDVIESNMQSDYYDLSKVNSEVLEFYTDTRKIQSIIFPVTGYRDYDDKAMVTSYSDPGKYSGIGFVWTSDAYDETNSVHLKFKRGNMINDDWQTRENTELTMDMLAKFYNCDGFAVRPISRSTK